MPRRTDRARAANLLQASARFSPNPRGARARSLSTTKRAAPAPTWSARRAPAARPPAPRSRPPRGPPRPVRATSARSPTARWLPPRAVRDSCLELWLHCPGRQSAHEHRRLQPPFAAPVLRHISAAETAHSTGFTTMPATTQPTDQPTGQLITDEKTLERLFRAKYSKLVADAKGRL